MRDKLRVVSWMVYLVLLNVHNLFWLPAHLVGTSELGSSLVIPIERISIFKYWYSEQGSYGTFYLYMDRIILFTLTLTLTFLVIDYMIRITFKSDIEKKHNEV